MTRTEFIKTVENSTLEGLFNNLHVTQYFEHKDIICSGKIDQFAIVSDHNSDELEKFWRVAYKFATMDEIGCTFNTMTLADARKKLAELMLVIY